MEIGTIQIAALTLGITQALKEVFNVSGKWNQVVAIVVGMALTAIAYGISNQLIPQDVIPYIAWFVNSVGGGLSAIGYFDIITNEAPKALALFADSVG